jgi:hypothetical protein
MLQTIDMVRATQENHHTYFETDPDSIKQWLIANELSLSEKIFGHELGAQIICAITKQSPDTMRQLKKMFNHYLNARQLSDDLHDWQHDYEHNRLTGITKPLFLSQYAFPTATSKERSQIIFWEEGIMVGIHQAQRELESASYLLRKIKWPKQPPALLVRVFEKVRSRLNNAIYEHRSMQALIKQYSTYGGYTNENTCMAKYTST